MNNREFEKYLKDSTLIVSDGVSGYIFRANTINNLPFGADYMAQSNADANGNYQTIIYKRGGAGGTVVKTISLTFDASGNVLTYSES